jgi:branched-chain amino acid transport system substrate-binding protein
MDRWVAAMLWQMETVRATLCPMIGSGRLWLALAGIVLGVSAMLFWLGQGRARGAPIRVAFAGPVSGLSAEDGLAGVRAVELVFDQVNTAGGIGGRPLVLDVYDDQNDAGRARANAPAIADEPNTIAVIGHNYSTCSIAAGEVYAARGLPAISSAATNVAVTRDNRWYFRVIFNDRAQGRFIALYLREVLGAERIGVMHETAAYGAYLASVVEEAAPARGLDVVGSWGFDAESPQLGERLDAIVREATGPGAPDSLVLAMQPAAGVAIIERLRDLGYPGRIVVSDALASQAFAEGFRDLPKERNRPGFYTDGIYASTPFLFDIVGRQAGVFLQDYLSRYDQSPVWYSAFSADAAKVIVEALRRAELSPSPETIAADRSALRDALVTIDSLDPVDGVTGPTYFDVVGDAEKPVSMGRFSNGEIVSAFGQLQLLPGIQKAGDLDARYDPARVVVTEEQVFYRSGIVRVGVLAERFEALDFENGTFELSFHIWFRHQEDREVEDVVFTNAVEPIELGEPVDEVLDGASQYRAYAVRGLFRADTIDFDYGQHVMALSLHHGGRTRDDLVYAIDAVGMNLGRERTRKERIARAHRLLGPNSPWSIANIVFFESEVEENAMGHPSYLSGATSARPFSQLTIGTIVRGQALSPRGLIPERYLGGLLIFGIVGSFIMLILRDRGSPKVRWLLQAMLALLILLAAEPLVANWIRSSAIPARLATISRSFDLLWWLVPAVLVNLAVERFVWIPTEARSGRPVPTLLRYSAAAVIYLLAVFGAVAFVYNYTLTGILATSGVMAMIIGLAVQLNITNLFAGVALNLERPFRVGDWVMIHGRTPDPSDCVTGKVVDINWRTTRLETVDDTEIVIPNGIISEKTITNFMEPREARRFELWFTVDQSVAPERVTEVIYEAMAELLASEEKPFVSDPRPKVRISRVTENGIEYVVHYRLLPSRLSPNEGRHLANEAVVRHLREAGIELAYPRRLYQGRSQSGPPGSDPGEEAPSGG